MDRPLERSFRARRLLRRVSLSGAALLSLTVVLAYGPGWVRPTLVGRDLRTARVEVGPVEATLSASGLVVPEFEQVLAAPLDARVLKILKKSGTVLHRGEPILNLDLSDQVLALEKLGEQIALKENAQTQKKLDLENTLINLKSQLRLKKVDLRSLEIQLQQQQTMRDAQLTSAEAVRLAQVAVEKARVETSQLEDSIRASERSTEAQLAGLALEIQTLRKEQEQSRRLLERATTNADRDGVLTWVVPEEGALVHKGDVLARLADLSAFRVDATISDVHASRLKPGMPARVRISEDKLLDGTIANVLPTIKDGVVSVQIALCEHNAPELRSNLRVDVFLVADRRQRTLRVKRGPFVNGEGEQPVFVLRHGKAVRTMAKLGLASFKHVELLSGVMEGDEVIISDMRDYVHMREIAVR